MRQDEDCDEEIWTKFSMKIVFALRRPILVSFLIRSYGKDPATKSDEFLEKFQTAFDPPPSFLENYVANLL